MPLYEYKCVKCGKVVEVLVRNSGAEPLECPECGAKGLEKLMSASSISVRGGNTSTGTRCGLGSPCCGADNPCADPPCGE